MTVTGPVGRPVAAHVGFLGRRHRRVAVVEVAAAAGLRLVPPPRRDPRLTTSYGVGELIRAALDRGAARVLVGCGDSGCHDGGAGMVEALGVRLVDARGRRLGRGGAALRRLARIELSGGDPRLGQVRIDAAVNWDSGLLGARGVTRMFGPQKGASPAAVLALEAALGTLAAVVRRDLAIDLASVPGAGASGGIGAALHALLGARLHPRLRLVDRFVGLDRLLARADLVLTAEGTLDGSTVHGKAPAELARRAKAFGLPVIALAGTIGPGAERTLTAGIDAYVSVLRRPCSAAEAMAEAPGLVAAATEQAMRLALLDWRRRPRARRARAGSGRAVGGGRRVLYRRRTS